MGDRSSVGDRRVYEAGDQRNYSQDDPEMQKDHFHQGKENSHMPNDSKDERTIANKLAREAKREKESEEDSEEVELSKKDATLPAKMHGNEPSKGAKIDQQIKEEEEEELRKKEAKKEAKK